MRRLIFLASILLVSMACTIFTPPPTPTAPPAPTPIPYKCSIVIGQGDGWSNVYYSLGPSSEYLVDGKLVKYEGAVLQPDQVVSLPHPAEGCSNGENVAVEVAFDTQEGDLTYDMSGFQEPITSARLERVLKNGCLNRNTSLGHGHNVDDLQSGCNYYSGVKYSLTDGTVKCLEYSSITELNNEFVPSADIMSLEIIITAVTSDMEDQHVCSTR